MRELAFYYPGPVWYSGDQMKNLILFFDGIALLVPEYIRDKPFLRDPAIATGLAQHGLLKILEPERFINAGTARSLADSLSDIIETGKLDRLTRTKTAFHELSYSRLGGFADQRVADELLRKLERRGWARKSEDGVSIPMHPVIRSVTLVLLAQLLRPVGRAEGLDLWPTTDRKDLVDGLTELLGLSDFPSAGHVVSADLHAVSVDLAPVPIDEVLDFRRRHGADYRAYARQLRQFIRSLGPLPPNERDAALRDRAEESRDRASDLRETSRRAWRRPAQLAVTIAGAAWTVHSGDLVAGTLGLGGALLGTELLAARKKVDAYSYLFAAKAL